MKKNEKLLKNMMVGFLILITVWFGIKPLLTGTSYRDYTKLGSNDYTFEKNEYATIVIGSEPEGIASALACSRTGLKTLILTGDSELGSYVSRSMISLMDPQQGLISKKKVLLNQGIYQEIFGKINIGFSGEDYIQTIKKLVESEKNLDVIYDSFLLEVDIEGETLKGILVQQPDGKHYYKARNFIDATFDGKLLTVCNTPYTKGSEDLGVPGLYAPLEFNFLVSGVDIAALKKSQKASDFMDEFRLALLAYKKINPNTKLISPSFISQSDHELVITGLKVFGVDVEDKKAVENAYIKAEDEARMLTAYLKTALVAFKNCTYKASPVEFFVPEYRHFEGRYKLTVADILDNRDFRDKIGLCSAAVDAGKFVNTDIDYIVAKPNVYAIPLGSIVPVNLENVLMTGAKASFSSLAATSAGSLPSRITVGQSAGYVAAYSFIKDISPSDILKGTDKELRVLKGYINRGGVVLDDFSESLLVPKTENKLSENWSYPYVKILAEYGLIAGGYGNDFKLDFKSSQELFAVLLKNAVIKMAPEYYDMEFDRAMKVYEQKAPLTGETAAVIILEALSVPFDKDKALEALKQTNLIPKDLTERLMDNEPVTMDVVYALSVKIVDCIGSIK